MVNISGDSALPILSSVLLSTWWIIGLTTDLEKPFQDPNFVIKFISGDNLFGKHIPDAREVKLGTMSVFLLFLKIDVPSEDNSKPRKCGTSF